MFVYISFKLVKTVSSVQFHYKTTIHLFVCGVGCRLILDTTFYWMFYEIILIWFQIKFLVCFVSLWKVAWIVNKIIPTVLGEVYSGKVHVLDHGDVAGIVRL